MNSEDLQSIFESGFSSRLDPHFYRLFLRQQNAEMRLRGDGDELLPVLVTLQNAKSPIAEVFRMTTRAGKTATGYVARDSLKELVLNPNVVTVERPRLLWPLLERSVRDAGASAAQLRTSLSGRAPLVTGKGVIVGVIDSGLDLAHLNFRGRDRSTRVLALWAQGVPTLNAPHPYGYGRELRKPEIDRLLALQTVEEVYRVDENSHGTSVTDIAAGNGLGTGEAGIAPDASIVFVDYGTGFDVAPDQSLCDSRRLYEAVDYIFGIARELGMPAVINISLGMYAGPHDGTTPLDAAFASHLEVAGRAIVIAAGNSARDGIHASGTVRGGLMHVLTWKVRETTSPSSEMEVWYPGKRELEVEVVSPGQQGSVRCPLNESHPIAIAGLSVGCVIHQSDCSGNHDNRVDLFLETVARRGSWEVRLTSRGSGDVPFDAWIERSFPTQSVFAQPDPAKTLNSIACGEAVIAVGAYGVGRQISRNSSLGPTRRDFAAPLLAAPGGRQVTAARSCLPGLRECSGTSASAPHVAGVVALMFHAAGASLTAAEIRECLAGTATALSGAVASEGRGALDGAAAINAILASREITNKGA